MQNLFRLTSLLAAASLLPWASASPATATGRPNVLVILTDQQHAGMMSCTGNRDLRTPHLDGLAARGTRFERAYASNPVCIPSRFSLIAGTMPSAIGMEHHGQAGNKVAPEILQTSLGAVFRGAGYRTVYAGKTHLPGPPGVIDNPAAYGFEERLAPEDKEGRDPATDACVAFLRQPPDRPFLLYVSLINPHDICYLAIREQQRAEGKPGPNPKSPWMVELLRALEPPAGVSREEFLERHLPPLPANYEAPEGELSAPWADKPDFMRFTREHWGEREWRLHRWAYARLTERVDGQVGRILEALHAAGLERNTLVVFTSDHGDQSAAHRQEHKAFLWEESVRIPLILAWEGVIRPGQVDREHLVGNGLDLLPTLCDFAGLPAPASKPGRSLRALAEGGKVSAWRDHLVVENTRSRLVHGGTWKYSVGHESVKQECVPGLDRARPAVRENLIDLAADPGEMRNVAGKPEGRERVREGRRLLAAWYREHQLRLDAGYLVAPE